jgi:hypothetical protein
MDIVAMRGVHKCKTDPSTPLLESAVAFLRKASQASAGADHKFTPLIIVDISTDKQKIPKKMTNDLYSFWGITFTGGDGYTLAGTTPTRVNGTAFLTNTGKYNIIDTSPVYVYTDGTMDHTDERVLSMGGPLFAPTVPGIFIDEAGKSFHDVFTDEKCLFRIGRAIKGGAPGDLMSIVLDPPRQT